MENVTGNRNEARVVLHEDTEWVTRNAWHYAHRASLRYPVDVDEVYGQLLLKAVEAAERWDGKRANPKTYLEAVMRRHVATINRSEMRRRKHTTAYRRLKIGEGGLD